MEQNAVALPITAIVEGMTWHLYSFEFTTPDGTFSSYLYAISPVHAAELLQDMRKSAVLSGRVV